MFYNLNEHKTDFKFITIVLNLKGLIYIIKYICSNQNDIHNIYSLNHPLKIWEQKVLTDWKIYIGIQPNGSIFLLL